ncbi:hypothetical protein CPB84DRAFT_1853211 [Gymnopilus junonius]|uniref:Uncharacterized protein n=1 Tax=Gymnopilus junonius TaxID=109634 RepID=A0A9P5NAA7_GYMJU|nr:hypothetical protein CPB84DRAFT_1853211 [Gymnopilus junonius]
MHLDGSPRLPPPSRTSPPWHITAASSTAASSDIAGLGHPSLAVTPPPSMPT